VALRHAEHINKQLQQDSLPAKDLFWVCASNIDSFDRTYTAIAAKLTAADPEFHSREDLWMFVKSRLEEKCTKKWFMVVDGLDHERETRIIEAFLPRRGSGKILITTRNTLLVKDLLDWQQRNACIEMEYPGTSTALDLLRAYVDKDLIEKDTKYAEQILHQLNCPEMIRRTSRYMNNGKLTCREMYKILKKRKYQEVERLLPDFAGFLLTPILEASLWKENEWSDELRLLVLLCLFDNEIGVDIKLIQVEYDEKDHKYVEE
jgi:disulfide oxidoreductase YuzD